MTEQTKQMTDKQTVETEIDEQEQLRLKRQRRRSIATALGLVLFVLTFFVLTMVRMGPDLFVRPL